MYMAPLDIKTPYTWEQEKLSYIIRNHWQGVHGSYENASPESFEMTNRHFLIIYPFRGALYELNVSRHKRITLNTNYLDNIYQAASNDNYVVSVYQVSARCKWEGLQKHVAISVPSYGWHWFRGTSYDVDSDILAENILRALYFVSTNNLDFYK